MPLAAAPPTPQMKTVDGMDDEFNPRLSAEARFDQAASRLGLASVLGARLTARRWVFAAGLVTDKLDEWVIVMNPGPRPARVSFTVLASGRINCASPRRRAASVISGTW